MRRKLAEVKKAAKTAQIYRYGEISHHAEQVACQVPVYSTVIQKQISLLKNTAKEHGLVSLSANQIKISNAIFVCLKKQWLMGRWRGYSPQLDHYEVILNPQLGKKDGLVYQQLGYDECPSFQGYRFRVKRPYEVAVRYATVQRDSLVTIERIINGFQARVWQHEIDHLHGHLPIEKEISNLEIELTGQYRNPVNQEELNNLLQKLRFLHSAGEIQKNLAGDTKRKN